MTGQGGHAKSPADYFVAKNYGRFPLGKQFTLTATDKHSLGAYRADPAGTPKGVACPKGMTTSMETIFFSATRLSRTKFALPAIVQPAAVSLEP